jgi:hypothetical protein
MTKIFVVAFLATAFACQSSRAQTDIVHVFIDPLLIKDIDNNSLTDALKAALSAEPLVLERKYSNGVLMITETDKPRYHRNTFEFSVSFFRNGSHLGDSIETCAANKISDCSDQLASDVKAASASRD